MNKLFLNIMGFVILLIICVSTVMKMVSAASTIENILGIVILVIGICGLGLWGQYILKWGDREDSEKTSKQN